MSNNKTLSILPSLIMLLLFISNCQNNTDSTNDNDGYNSENNTLTDSRDGKIYQTVTIGSQVWMAENLAYEPSNGNYWAYNNDDENMQTYGYLYKWETATDVCPEGWHLPSDTEWMDLEIELGMSQTDANLMNAPDGRGTDEGSKLAGNAPLWITAGDLKNNSNFGTSGFTGLPGGYRVVHAGNPNVSRDFNSLGGVGKWWSSTETTPNTGAIIRQIVWQSSQVKRANRSKETGLSVRCIRN